MRVLEIGRRCAMRAAHVGCAAGLAFTPLAVSAHDEDAAVKPFQVIDRAVMRWRERPRPEQLSFVVEFIGHNKDRAFRRRYRVDDRVADHAPRVTVLASDGPAPPFVQPEKPRLLPTETFGFVPSDADAPVPTPTPGASALPVIAAVHATVRYPYDVTFVGIANVDERPAYHLQLDPRGRSDAYPLREMWIDVETYDVLQVVAQQFEHLGPITIPYRITARYAQQGPYWLIAHAEAGATIHAGIFSYGSSADADFKNFEYSP